MSRGSPRDFFHYVSRFSNLNFNGAVTFQYNATDAALFAATPATITLNSVLQLRLGHGDNLEIHPLARADSLAKCLLGLQCLGPGGQGAMSLGLVVLPEGQDGQDLLPAH
jgi:hypothetical protein